MNHGSRYVAAGVCVALRHDRAAKIVKAAHASGATLREEAIKDGIPAADYVIVRPEKMIGPG